MWEEMPLIQVCTEMGGLLEFCGHVIVPVLFFAVGFFQGKPLWGVLSLPDIQMNAVIYFLLF